MYRAATKNSHAEASADLFEYAGVTVYDRQIQQLVQEVAPAMGLWLRTVPERAEIALMYVCGDGTGVPMRKEELAA